MRAVRVLLGLLVATAGACGERDVPLCERLKQEALTYYQAAQECAQASDCVPPMTRCFGDMCSSPLSVANHTQIEMLAVSYEQSCGGGGRCVLCGDRNRPVACEQRRCVFP